MKGEGLLIAGVLIINFILWFSAPLDLYEQKTKLEIDKLNYELKIYKEQDEDIVNYCKDDTKQ